MAQCHTHTHTQNNIGRVSLSLHPSAKSTCATKYRFNVRFKVCLFGLMGEHKGKPGESFKNFDKKNMEEPTHTHQDPKNRQKGKTKGQRKQCGKKEETTNDSGRQPNKTKTMVRHARLANWNGLSNCLNIFIVSYKIN